MVDSREYWEALSAIFSERLPGLEWKPFRNLKVFKIGLHWATVYRTSDGVHRTSDGAHIQYWVSESLIQAFEKACEIARLLAFEFEERFKRPV